MVAPLDRREAVAFLLERLPPETLIVTGLGSPSYDAHAAGDRPQAWYLWGAMGSAALVGLGLAQAQPSRRVLVLTGDGEQLMGLGGLATIGIAGPRTLDIVVIDNGHFGETGMQQSHTGRGLSIDRVAAACGFAETGEVTDMAGVERLSATLAQVAVGPRLHTLKVKAENLPRSLPPRDAVYMKNRFRAALGLPVA